jgi:hypothetical protein
MGEAMKVLDLYSGLEGWSKPWRERGHEVYRVEINPAWPAEHRDILTFKPSMLPWQPDIILASPPCTAFSVLQIGRNWTHDHQPKTDAALHGLKLLNKTVSLIKAINPRWFVMENPRAKMRKMPQVQAFERHTVTYCQYGERRMKPTDLWGRFPEGLKFKEPCKNGMSCHVSAPRGSTTGTQGMDSAESAVIPRLLSLAICKAAEKALARGL